MKIKPEHFQVIKDKIESYFKQYGKDALILRYENGDFPHAQAVKNLQTRFNFDALHYSGALSGILNDVYQYANDEHIATALKKICPKVIKRY